MYTSPNVLCNIIYEKSIFRLIDIVCDSWCVAINTDRQHEFCHETTIQKRFNKKMFLQNVKSFNEVQWIERCQFLIHEFYMYIIGIEKCKNAFQNKNILKIHSFKCIRKTFTFFQIGSFILAGKLKSTELIFVQCSIYFHFHLYVFHLR